MPLKRKRGFTPEATEDEISWSLLDQIRNMEEFASLGQYLFMFGTGALKLPDFGREELETELLAPQSALLDEIRLALIRMVMVNPRLVLEQFDEQAQKQFVANRRETNPFGEQEVARPFVDMDLFTKIRVLHQLSVWTFIRPHLMRERMEDVDPAEELSWRMDHCGYDKHGNTYYLLDDNRLYRRTPFKETVAPTKKKAQPKQRKGQKRRRVSAVTVEESEQGGEVNQNFQSLKWSCVCVTLQEWEAFVVRLKGSKDQDEGALYEYLGMDVLPEIRKAESLKQKKLFDELKEQQKLEAVANRKRSSRIDEKMTRRREEEKKAAEADIQEQLLHKAQVEERKKYKEREARLMARERRNKEREWRGQVPDAGSSATSCNGSVSGRRASTRVQMKSAQKSQRKLESDKDWEFDCRCGVHGEQYEGGSKIIACDKCDIWQHLRCQNLPPSFTEGDFTCERCRSREQAETVNSRRITIKLRISAQNEILPMDTSQDQGMRTPLDQLEINFPVSQVTTQNKPGHETLHPSSQGIQEPGGAMMQGSSVDPNPSEQTQAGVNRVTNGYDSRERSAQASADFLLFMADPEHVTSSNPPQPDTKTAVENTNLPNGT